MALTYTPPVEDSATLPVFELKTVTGEHWTSESLLTAPAKVIVFMCNHCPYVKAIEDRIVALAAYLNTKGVPFVGICSNDPTDYPEDRPEKLLERWREKEYGFPYLVDTEQTAAKQLGAVCTPDFFVYDKNNRLAYRGRLDDSWKDASKVQKQELKNAVECLLDGRQVEEAQSPSMGCSIKWRE